MFRILGRKNADLFCVCECFPLISRLLNRELFQLSGKQTNIKKKELNLT